MEVFDSLGYGAILDEGLQGVSMWAPLNIIFSCFQLFSGVFCCSVNVESF